MPTASMGVVPCGQEMKRVRQLAGASGGYSLPRAGARDPSASRLHSARDTAPLQASRFPWKPTDSMAAVKSCEQRLHLKLASMNERALTVDATALQEGRNSQHEAS